MNIEGIETVTTHRPTTREVSLPNPSQREDPAPVRSDAPETPQASPSVIQFSADQVSGKMLIQIVNPESGEVVRQIPPEELITLSRILGLLFDQVV